MKHVGFIACDLRSHSDFLLISTNKPICPEEFEDEHSISIFPGVEGVAPPFDIPSK